MQAVFACRADATDPLGALRVGEFSAPAPTDDQVTVAVRAAALNHHDLWVLRGTGVPRDRYPIILGADCSGVDERGEVVLVHGVACRQEFRHAPVRDPGRVILGEGRHGTFAEFVSVPAHMVSRAPSGLSHTESACLPGTWLTAYRMLFTKAQVRPGNTVLVQGAGGGVATALVQLGCAAGCRMWVTRRSARKRDGALRLGAHAVFPANSPLPAPADVVMESVGKATWGHSLRSVRPGGTVVVTGATTGADGPAHLGRVFWNELRIVGSTSGTPEEMHALIAFIDQTGVRPVVDTAYHYTNALAAARRLLAGDVFGKLVLTW
jgi:NADPH:quinone reductase-like Zn-dependent oxidoreductase